MISNLHPTGMIKLSPPDPLAFTGPLPLADLAPQSMMREQIESVVSHAPKLFQTGGDMPDDRDIPAKAVARGFEPCCRQIWYPYFRG